MAQATSPHTDPATPLVSHSDTHPPRWPEWSSHHTALISVSFLHKNTHHRMKCRLLSAVSGTPHHQYRPTRVPSHLLQAPHGPWLITGWIPLPSSTAHTIVPSRAHPEGLACVVPLPGCPPPPSSFLSLPAASQSPRPLSSNNRSLLNFLLAAPCHIHLYFGTT